MNEVYILCVLETTNPVKLVEADVPVTLEEEAYPVKLD